MEIQQIADALPDKLPLQARSDALSLCRDSLGGDYLVFRRVQLSDDAPQWWDTPTPPASYASECRCTACGAKVELGYAPGRKRDKLAPGVIYSEGEDGVIYSGPVWAESEFAVTVRDGGGATCPDCGKAVTLRHASYFRNPKTFRCLCAQVENVGTLTAVIFWMFSRSFRADGDTSLEVTPFRAVVLDDNRKLRHFRWNPGAKRWKSSTVVDPSCVAYVSADGGAAMHQKVGAFISRRVPDLAGMSGEKTGLAEYVAAAQDGGFPVTYLRFWTKFPSVENVVKAGWGFTVDSAIRQSMFNLSNKLTIPHALENLCDWRQASPAKLLRMDKRAVRQYAPKQWAYDKLKLWLDMSRRGVFAPDDVGTFTAMVSRYTVPALSGFDALLTGRKFNIRKIDNYLMKQFEKHKLAYNVGFELLCDYRRIFEDINRAAPNQVEMYPPDLRTAHNRLARQAATMASKVKAERYLKTYETWKGLEYSDGQICARLPLCAADLIHEGHTLNHCVGSYGERHCSGKLIIFIRHARHPERPWFTLNVSVTDDAPREIQLHGYGNEHANGKQLHIPKRVREFCDKWEKDVLTPVFHSVRAKEART